MTGFCEPLRIVCDPPLRDPAAGPGATLEGLRLAVKDVIDVAGIATGAGNPDYLARARPAAEHALGVNRLLTAGAAVIGKAHTDEFAFSLSGTNVHYGTPRNPAAPGRIPGGSSSGSAAAVAGGIADIALGTDTAGSIRIPSAYCGVYGMRPSHGRVPLDGVLGLAPSFDTCGVVAASGRLLEDAGLALLAAGAGEPPGSLVLAGDLFDGADAPVAAAVERGARDLAARLGVEVRVASFAGERLGAWLSAFRRCQFAEVWDVHGRWLEENRPALGPGVAVRFATARETPRADVEPARGARREVCDRLGQVLASGGALVIPSAATVAPPPAMGDPDKEVLRARTIALTCVAGLAGAPAVSIPVRTAAGLPAGICLVGLPGADERLLAAARVAGNDRWL